MAKAGYAQNRWLVYGTLGWAVGRGRLQLCHRHPAGRSRYHAAGR